MSGSVPPEEPEFRSVYEQEFGYVYCSLRRLGVRDADLKDLAHDVFLLAWRRFDRWDRARPVRPWLFGITFRVVSDFRRKPLHRETQDDDAINERRTDGGPEEQIARGEARSVVLRALERLPEARRAVFILHDLDGCAASEIAESLGLPANTVYSRLRVARSEFVAAVRRLGATP